MKNLIARFLTFSLIFLVLLSIELMCIVVPVSAQSKPALSTKIKVYLLGTFHFDSSPTDVIKGTKVDMNTPQNQAELDELVSKLKRTHADKVFVEWPLTSQPYVDSTYNLYRENRFKLGNNEVYQVGYRLAKALNRPRVYCADADGDWNYDSAVTYANEHSQKKLIESVYHDTPTDSVGLLIENRIKAIQATQPKLPQHSGNTLLDQFIRMNEASDDPSGINGYLLYLSRVGGGDNYVGADLAGDFYKRNMRIYTNLLRQVDVKHDKAIILIIGGGHLPFLKSILQYNLLFEVENVLPLLTDK